MASTTIRLDPTVRDDLKRFGSKGETYNDIIRRLMEVAELHSIHAEARRVYLQPERHTFTDMEDL